MEVHNIKLTKHISFTYQTTIVNQMSNLQKKNQIFVQRVPKKNSVHQTISLKNEHFVLVHTVDQYKVRKISNKKFYS